MLLKIERSGKQNKENSQEWLVNVSLGIIPWVKRCRGPSSVEVKIEKYMNRSALVVVNPFPNDKF